MLHILSYPEESNSETESRTVASRDGGGRNKRLLLMGIEFHSCKTNELWRSGAQPCGYGQDY